MRWYVVFRILSWSVIHWQLKHLWKFSVMMILKLLMSMEVLIWIWRCFIFFTLIKIEQFKLMSSIIICPYNAWQYWQIEQDITQWLKGKGKYSPYSITEHRVPELIPVLGCQPAGDVSHKPGGRLSVVFFFFIEQTLSFMHCTCNFICGLSDVIIKTFSQSASTYRQACSYPCNP